jgi:drug/metabolite transporter (DMT)-like permease
MSSFLQLEVRRRAGFGLSLAFASVGLFAISPTLARLSYESGAGPLSTNFVRGLMLVALFSAPLLLRGGQVSARAPLARLAQLVLGLSYAAFAWAYQMAIFEIGAGLSLVAASASAILVILWLARPAGRKRSPHPAGLPEFAAALVTLSGVYLLAEDANAGPMGLIYCALIMVSCCVMTVSAEWAANLGVTASARGRAIGLGMLLLIVPLLFGYQDVAGEAGAANWWVLTLPADGWGWLAFFGSAVAMIGAISCYSAAIGHVGAVRVSLIANAEPALGLLIAWAIVDEQLGLYGILGGLLASLGLIDWRRMLGDRGRTMAAVKVSAE